MNINDFLVDPRHSKQLDSLGGLTYLYGVYSTTSLLPRDDLYVHSLMYHYLCSWASWVYIMNNLPASAGNAGYKA